MATKKKNTTTTPRKGRGSTSKRTPTPTVTETTAPQGDEVDVTKTGGDSAGTTDVPPAGEVVIPSGGNEAETTELQGGELIEETEIKGDILSTIPVVVLGGCGATEHQIEIARLAWEKNFPEAQVVIVGVDIPYTLSGDDPVANHTDMIVAALASDLVPEYFVFAPIGTFPVSQIQTSDLYVFKAWDATSHKEEMQTIAKVMKLKNIPSYYYPTLLPMVLGKEHVAEIIEEYKLDKNIVNLNTVYMTHYFPNLVPFIADVNSTVLARVTRANPDMDAVARVLPKRMFFHCNGDGLKAIAGLLTERLG